MLTRELCLLTAGTRQLREKEPDAIGVQGIILNPQGQILLGLRIGKRYGANTWGLIGGRARFGEDPRVAFFREVSEETGLVITPASLADEFIVDTFGPGRIMHRQHVFVVTDAIGTPLVLEPEACGRVEFYPLDSLPGNLFGPTRTILQQYLPRISRSGHNA